MKNKANLAILSFGAVFGLWALTALVSAIAQVGSLTELTRQYMVATGMVTPLHTLVDYYTHIKGIEYLIVVAFLIIFPVFFMYTKENTEKVLKTVKS